jgi:hypothetical protein
VIEIALDERQRFLDAQPRAPEDHDQATQASPVRVVPAVHMTEITSSTLGGSAG